MCIDTHPENVELHSLLHLLALLFERIQCLILYVHEPFELTFGLVL